jgi:Ca-activated chloride channel family protein
MRLPRQIKNSLLPLLLLVATQKVCAQLAPPDDFFNSGAQFYISNNIPAALQRTEDGLKLYPDNEKLKKLEQLLKQQQQSQSQQNQQNQQKQSQNSKSQNQQQKQQQQNSQSQQQKQDEQKKDEQQKQAQQQKSAEQKKQNDDKQPVAGQMTPEEAKRLLDGQKGDEQVLQFKPQGKPENPNQPVKDW